MEVMEIIINLMIILHLNNFHNNYKQKDGRIRIILMKKHYNFNMIKLINKIINNLNR